MHYCGDAGLWASFRDGVSALNRPALFLDRDGVLVEDVHFLRRPEDVRLMPGMETALLSANEAGIPVIVVTNQSGIARGHFGWEAFVAVQEQIATALSAAGAWCDGVLACGHLEGGQPPFDTDARGWRKPNPGMLLAARERLGLDLARSAIIGDRLSDLDAGHKAGLRSGILVLTGYGARDVADFAERQRDWHRAGYDTRVIETPADAVRQALSSLN